jgi:2-C-methyl-D-erythritol 2,4-cyclodiphosphate synthase
MYRIGTGLDVHAFAAGRKLMLGCVEIEHPRGLAGHSDADVLVHAATDAILGALGRRDIGFHYPPDGPRWLGYPGWKFMEDMRQLLAESGYELVNLDAVVVAEQPRLSPYIPDMIARLAGLLGVAPACLGIKAKTTEGLGFLGRQEGILAQVVVLLHRVEPPSPGGDPQREQVGNAD